jgi:hypothetical protein
MMHTKCRKGLTTYHKSNGIIAMKKHVEGEHFTLVKRLAKDPNCILVEPGLPLIKMLSKKRAHVYPYEIFGLSYTSSKFKKDDPTQVGFLDDLMLLVVKVFLPMRILEFVWL